MKQRLSHICLYLLMAVVFQGLASCVYDRYDDGTDVNDDATAMLYIRANSLDSRSGDLDMESMNSLRVIILHGNGSLEQNYFVDNLNGTDTHEYIFKVSRDDTKKIYLIANEGSIPGVDLNTLGTEPSKTLEDITFTAMPVNSDGNSDPKQNPVFSKGIPMSSCYELHVGNESRIEKDFYVVRAMTKITFTFQNGRTDAVTVKELKASAFADRSFLIPHLHDGNFNNILSEKFMVDPTGTYASDASLFWVDWLKNAVDKSLSDSDSSNEVGWISQYTVPAGTDYTTANIEISESEAFIVPSSGGSVEYSKPFYRCESIYIPDGKSEQEYKIDYLKVRAERDEQDKVWQNLPVLRLNQIRYLFRHTHVKVNVVFGMTEVVIFARIHPWVPSEPTTPRPLEPEN